MLSEDVLSHCIHAAIFSRSSSFYFCVQNEPTVPSLLGVEFRTNPFLRPGDAGIRAALGVAPDASNEEAFAAIRGAKDSFR